MLEIIRLDFLDKVKKKNQVVIADKGRIWAHLPPDLELLLVSRSSLTFLEAGVTKPVPFRFLWEVDFHVSSSSLIGQTKREFEAGEVQRMRYSGSFYPRALNDHNMLACCVFSCWSHRSECLASTTAI